MRRQILCFLAGLLLLALGVAVLYRCAAPRKPTLRVTMTEAEVREALGPYQWECCNALRQVTGDKPPRYWIVFDRDPRLFVTGAWLVAVSFDDRERLVSWHASRREDYFWPRWITNLSEPICW